MDVNFATGAMVLLFVAFSYKTGFISITYCIPLSFFLLLFISFSIYL